nr:sensor domain-containing protein [Candidatus Frankia alpina]
MTAPVAASADPVPAPKGAGTAGSAAPRQQRLAASAATWRGLLFLLLNLPLSIIGFVWVTMVLALGAGLVVTVIGIPVLALGLQVCRVFGTIERVRARSLLGLRVDVPSRRPRRRAGGLGAMFAALADPVSWRTALYLFIRLPWGIVSFVAAVLLLTVGWVVLPAATRGLVAVDRAMIRSLLSPSEGVERRIRELEADRGALADAAAADLRRIERDLHDGAQARLVALAMGLGLAKEKLVDDPDAAARMVAEAHGEAKLALQELRDLARGIHPRSSPTEDCPRPWPRWPPGAPCRPGPPSSWAAARPPPWRASSTSPRRSCSPTSANTAAPTPPRSSCAASVPPRCYCRSVTTASAGRIHAAARAWRAWRA